MTREDLDRIIATDNPALIAAACITLYAALQESEAEIAALSAERFEDDR